MQKKFLPLNALNQKIKEIRLFPQIYRHFFKIYNSFNFHKIAFSFIAYYGFDFLFDVLTALSNSVMIGEKGVMIRKRKACQMLFALVSP